ncbi:hypothetical protein E2C01_088305 [Portunus trituberculatus]|uniref:Uncharacterized protein n=1 Tax=Portunus trituberculatus TaxID=210409 RepID=A0A5B7JFM0_PORTR|nr:hypothetical protein [Portunus trituberculatus]
MKSTRLSSSLVPPSASGLRAAISSLHFITNSFKMCAPTWGRVYGGQKINGESLHYSNPNRRN